MQPSEMINEYLDAICSKIMWKKARNRVSEEMRDHIIDGRNFYMSQGCDETAATKYSIADTGNASEIGAELNRIHQPKEYNLVKTGITLILIALLTYGYLYTLTELGLRIYQMPFQWYQKAPLPYRACSYLGTWGLGLFPFVLSTIGFLVSIKASYKTSLLCSIGIPSLSLLAIFVYAIMNTWLEIPILDQFDNAIGEEATLAGFCMFILPTSCIIAFTFAQGLCSYKQRRKEKRMESYAISE